MFEVNETQYGKILSKQSKNLVIYLHGLISQPFNHTGVAILNLIKHENLDYDVLGFQLHDAKGFLTTTVEKQAENLNQAIMDFSQSGYENIYIIASSYGSLTALVANNVNVKKQCFLLPSLVVDEGWRQTPREKVIFNDKEYFSSFYKSNVPVMFSEEFLNDGISFTEVKSQNLVDSLKVETLFCHGADDGYFHLSKNIGYSNPNCSMTVLGKYSHDVLDRDKLDLLVKYAFDYFK
ncbi:MAG TPA: hypothetical protein DCL21_01865 [Alphaproteobacteria bacterium]|nr:hypothetical protein [Alphaproteobacteria bacterium]